MSQCYTTEDGQTIASCNKEGIYRVAVKRAVIPGVGYLCEEHKNYEQARGTLAWVERL